MYWMAAVVEPYQHRRGDADRGFRALRSLCLDHVGEQLSHCSNSQQQLQRLDQVMHAIQNSNHYFCFHGAPEDLIDTIADAMRNQDISRLRAWMPTKGRSNPSPTGFG